MLYCDFEVEIIKSLEKSLTKKIKGFIEKAIKAN